MNKMSNLHKVENNTIQNSKVESKSTNVIVNLFTSVFHQIQKAVDAVKIAFKPKLERLEIQESKILAEINAIGRQIIEAKKEVSEFQPKQKKLEKALADVQRRKCELMRKDYQLQVEQASKELPAHGLAGMGIHGAEALQELKACDKQEAKILSELNSLGLLRQQKNAFLAECSARNETLENQLRRDVQGEILKIQQTSKKPLSTEDKLHGIYTTLKAVVGNLENSYHANTKLDFFALTEYEKMKKDFTELQKQIGNNFKKNSEIDAKLTLINDKLIKAELIIVDQKLSAEKNELTRTFDTMCLNQEELNEYHQRNIQRKNASIPDWAQLNSIFFDQSEQMKIESRVSEINEQKLEIQAKLTPLAECINANQSSLKSYAKTIEKLINGSGVSEALFLGKGKDSKLLEQFKDKWLMWRANPTSISTIENLLNSIHNLSDTYKKLPPEFIADELEVKLVDDFVQRNRLRLQDAENLSVKDKVQAAADSYEHALDNLKRGRKDAAFTKDVLEYIEKNEVVECLQTMKKLFIETDQLRAEAQKLDQLETIVKTSVKNEAPKGIYAIKQTIDNVKQEAEILFRKNKFDAETLSQIKVLQDKLDDLAVDKSKAVILKKYPKLVKDVINLFGELLAHKKPPRPSQPAPQVNYSVRPARPSNPAPAFKKPKKGSNSKGALASTASSVSKKTKA